MTMRPAAPAPDDDATVGRLIQHMALHSSPVFQRNSARTNINSMHTENSWLRVLLALCLGLTGQKKPGRNALSRV